MLWLDWSQITPALYLLDCTRLETAKKIAGKDLVSCQLLEGNLKELFCTTSFWPEFPLLSVFFQSKQAFLQVSFKILVQTSRHWAGMSKETRLQNGEKISRDWSVSVAIWSSRCQCSQSISRPLSNGIQWLAFRFFRCWHNDYIHVVYLIPSTRYRQGLV